MNKTNTSDQKCTSSEHFTHKCILESFLSSCSVPVFSLCVASEFPELLLLPAHVVENMLKALRMNSEEARLRFPRLLQIIELYPSETLDIMTKEVSV